MNIKKELKEFLLEGNVVDIAIGTLVGTAVNPLINSVIKDLIMPPVGYAIGGSDFEDLFAVVSDGKKGGPYKTKEEAKADGAVVVGYGSMINQTINFIIVGGVAFLFVLGINNLRQKMEEKKSSFKNPVIDPQTLKDQKDLSGIQKRQTSSNTYRGIGEMMKGLENIKEIKANPSIF